jgi:hypothetical protein
MKKQRMTKPAIRLISDGMMVEIRENSSFNRDLDGENSENEVSFYLESNNNWAEATMSISDTRKIGKAIIEFADIYEKYMNEYLEDKKVNNEDQ